MVGITLPDVAMVSGSVFALSSLFGVTSVLTGSVLFNAVYSATIGWYRGFTFMFGALLYTIPITISVCVSVVSFQWRIYIVKFWTRLGPNSFNFMQFLGNLAKSYVGAPPPGVGAPPRGNPGSATVRKFWN